MDLQIASSQIANCPKKVVKYHHAFVPVTALMGASQCHRTMSTPYPPAAGLP